VCLTVLAAFVVGCNQPDVDANDADDFGAEQPASTDLEAPDVDENDAWEAAEPAENVEEPAKVEPPQEKIWEGRLSNGSFEEWQESKPVDWQVRNQIAKTVDAYSGNAAVEFLDSGENYPMLIQDARRGEELLGRKLHAAAYMLAHEAEIAAVALTFEVDGEEQSFTDTHPGDGEWHNVSIGKTLPEEADPESIRFRIFRRPNAEGPVLVDSATLRIMDEE
jgi:hypothetical protein